MNTVSLGHALDLCWLGLEPGRKLQLPLGLLMRYYQNMMKSKAVVPKPNKGGIPATGRDPVTAIRLSTEFRAAVDKWAARQDDQPPRSEAIRRLVEVGLATPQTQRSARRNGRSLDLGHMAKLTPAPAKTTRHSRARELAAEAIDKMHDPAASAEERDQRRHRLTKGPPEFREHRVDLPKAKRK
jgi:hypothetical protein